MTFGAADSSEPWSTLTDEKIAAAAKKVLTRWPRPAFFGSTSETEVHLFTAFVEREVAARLRCKTYGFTFSWDQASKGFVVKTENETGVHVPWN